MLVEGSSATGVGIAVSLVAVLLLAFGRRLFTCVRALYSLTALPGPKADGWLAGHFLPERIPQLHRWYKRWADQYGRVYALRLATFPIIVVSDPLLMPELFKLPRSFLYQDFNLVTLNKPNIFTRDHSDPVWKAVRKAVAKVFTQSNLMRHFPAVLRHVNALVDGRCAAAARTGDPLEFVHTIKILMLWMLGEVGFELDLAAPERQAQIEHTLACMERAMAEMARRVASPLRWLCLWDADVAAGRRDLADWDAAISAFADEAMRPDSRASAVDGPPGSIVAALRGARMADGRVVPRELVIAEVATFFFVGTDTTSHTLAWTLLLLCQHPACKARVIEELERVGLKSSPGKPAREITFADLTKLPYINACLQESMRLQPVVGVGTWRDADRDLNIGGYAVAKGTSIGLAFTATFTSDANFPDALQFRPERWLDGGGGAQAPLTVTGADSNVRGAAGSAAAEWQGCPFAGGKRALPQQSYPFSVGDRNCIGRSLALMEMPLFMAKLLSRFDVAYAADVRPLEDIFANEMYAATSGPPFLHLRLSAWE